MTQPQQQGPEGEGKEKASANPGESKEDIKLQKTRGRTDVALDVLEEQKVHTLERKQFELQTNAPEFAHLDVKESAEKQKPALYALAGTTMFELIPYLLVKGISLESLQDFSAFRAPPQNLDTIFKSCPNPEGIVDLQSSFETIRTIVLSSVENPGSVKAEWGKFWPTMIQMGQDGVPALQSALDHKNPLSPPDVAPDGKTKDKEDKGIFDSFSSTEKYACLGVAAAVAGYGLYKLFDWLSEDKVDTKSDKKNTPAQSSHGFWSTMESVAEWTGVAALTTFGLGRLSEIDFARKWLKEIGLDDFRIIKAVRLLSHFEFQKAWEMILNGINETDAQKKLYGEAAQKITEKIKIPVTPDTIRKIADAKFLDLFPQNLVGKFGKAISDLGATTLEKLPIIGNFLEEDTAFKKEFMAIQKYLELPEVKKQITNINPGAQVPVEYVFGKLFDVELTPPPTAEVEAQAFATTPVVPAGPEGQKAQTDTTEENKDREGNHQKMVTEILKGEVSGDTVKKTQEDVEKFIDQLTDIEKASTGYWSREAELWRKFIGRIPDRKIDNEDCVAFMQQLDHVEGMDRAILQDYRTQAAELQTQLKELKNGKKLSDSEKTALHQGIDKFYKDYKFVAEKLQNVNGKRIQEEEAENRSSEAQKNTKHLVNGIWLLGNTLWGIPYSVFYCENLIKDKDEKNGSIVKIYAVATVATTGWGAYKGGVGGALRGSLKPLTWTGKQGAETIRYLDYLQFQNHTMEQVAKGIMKPQEGIDKLIEYARIRGYRMDGNNLVITTNGKVFPVGKVKNVVRGELTKDRAHSLEVKIQNLRNLKDLRENFGRVQGNIDKLTQEAEVAKLAAEAAKGTSTEAVTALKAQHAAQNLAKANVELEETAGKLLVEFNKVSPANKLQTVGKVAGVAGAVIGLAAAIYMLYDSSSQLYKTTKDETFREVAATGERSATALRGAEAQKNQEILDEKNIPKKLFGARDIALKLKVAAEDYGNVLNRRDVESDKPWYATEKFKKGVEIATNVLDPSALAMSITEPMAEYGTGLIYGDTDSKMKNSERTDMQSTITQGNELLAQLDAVPLNHEPEVNATVNALSAAIQLAEITLKDDKQPEKDEVDRVWKIILKAREAAKKTPYTEDNHGLEHAAA